MFLFELLHVEQMHLLKRSDEPSHVLFLLLSALTSILHFFLFSFELSQHLFYAFLCSPLLFCAHPSHFLQLGLSFADFFLP